MRSELLIELYCVQTSPAYDPGYVGTILSGDLRSKSPDLKNS